MSWDRVGAWLDRLRADIAHAPDTGLSTAGLRLVLEAALDELRPDRLAAADLPGEPWPSATFVQARTVVTAPLEWLAVLLGRGTRVTLKHPRGEPGLGPWLADHAQGLPLRLRDDHTLDGDLVVAMGHDDTISALRRSMRPDQHLLGFGHRYSAAWLPEAGHAEALARDLAAHDSRGCMSPAVVLGPPGLLPAVAEAMADAQRRWPRGRVSEAEHAALRARAALGRAAGEVLEGDGWQVVGLPPGLASPVALPRSVQWVDADPSWLAPRGAALSVLGVPPGLHVDPPGPTARVVPLGTMQQPPLVRRHDGVDWLRETLRRPG